MQHQASHKHDLQNKYRQTAFSNWASQTHDLQHKYSQTAAALGFS